MAKRTRSVPRDRTVGSYEAKAKLAQLLGEVAQGATVTVTRRGKPVARIVPIDHLSGDTATRTWEAWFRLRDERNITTGGIALRTLIEEGRRL